MKREKSLTNAGQPLYTPAGFYMLRAPALPASSFLHIMDGCDSVSAISENLDSWLEATQQQSYERLRHLIADPVVEQALMVASADLSEGLKRIQQGNASQQRIKHAYSRVLRYLIRMSTRPTPFGLFSGVSIGTLDEHTKVQLASSTIQRIRTRPAMDWLLSVIQKIEEDQELVPQLHVTVNRTAYIAGARIVIPYADIYGKGDNRSITFRATPVVVYVMEQVHTPVPYKTLRQKILTTFPQAKEAQVDTLLQQLWKNHFLMSDLRSPLMGAAPEQYLIERLRIVPGAAPIAEALVEIVQVNAEIDRTGVGGSSELLYKLTQKQQQIVTDQKNQPYQIDAALSLEASHLNKEIGAAVAEALEVLLRMSRSPHGSQHLREYYQAFVERYGMDAEVPVLDLLSPESGLDAPPGYTEPPRTYALTYGPASDMQHRNSLLCSILMEAVQEGALEIELTDALLERLTQWRLEPDNLPPPTLELYMQIHAASQEALDEGDWRGIISPACMAYGGSTFCRFFDVLSEEHIKKLQAYMEHEQVLSPDSIFTELSYLPTAGHGANVVIRPVVRSYEIVVNTAPSVPLDRIIPLNDLVVGVKGKRFYLRSLGLGKEVIVTQSHMLNIIHAPNICRFLLEVSRQGEPTLSSFDWGTPFSAPFLPRIVRKKIVLSLAQWHLQQSIIQPIGGGSEQARFFTGLQKWREKWRVPRYVYLTKADNRLLLDLNHPLSVAELHEELKKLDEQNILILQEMLPDFEHLWLRDKKNEPYIAELVVPVFINMQRIAEAKHTVGEKQKQPAFQKTYPRHPIPNAVRRQLPGAEWTFLKLYATTKQHDEIISGPVRKIVHAMNHQHLIDRWFFMRYNDPEPHLRLRFHSTSEQTRVAVLTDALSWSRELISTGLISNLVVDAYDREIERYGGPKAIDAIEMVFSANSVAISALVAAMHTSEITLDPLAVAVFTLDRFFELWGLNFSERLSYIQKRTEKHEARDAYHEKRKYFCELLVPWDSDEDLSFTLQREKLHQICDMQRPALENVSAHLRDLARTGELWLPEQNILSSLAHMHVNRLLGIERARETLVYAFWRYTLESLERRPAGVMEKRKGKR